MQTWREVQAVTGGQVRRVNVAALEAELSALWRAAAESQKSEHPVTRSCLLTLLVYEQGDQEGQQASELASWIMFETPCRTVVMMAEPESQAKSLEAWISARCRLDASGERSVCCDQVVVRALGESVGGMANIVAPLAVPDLPVYLWWRAKRFSLPPGFEQILRITDRVLVDSARFADPFAGHAELARSLPNRAAIHQLALVDLNWARLTSWRELMAHCFDLPAARPYLDRLSEVQVEWRANDKDAGVCSAQAPLVAGWLASRLGWKLAAREQGGGARRIFRFLAGDRPVRVTLGPGSGDQAAAGCFSILMKSDGAEAAVFSVEEMRDGECARTKCAIPGRPAMERVVRLEKLDEVRLVAQEMKFFNRDAVYEEALGMAAQMGAA